MAIVTDVTRARLADERHRWEEARNGLLLRLLQEQGRSADEGAVMAAAAEGLGRCSAPIASASTASTATR
jgi:hypothetical protein